MHFTEYGTRLAAYGLLTTDDGQILLTWFNGAGHAEPGWTMPGGGVDFDESIEAAVSREVFEETGYRVQVGRMLAEHHFTVFCAGDRRPMRSQRFILAASITGGQLGTTETGGTTDSARICWRIATRRNPQRTRRRSAIHPAIKTNRLGARRRVKRTPAIGRLGRTAVANVRA